MANVERKDSFENSIDDLFDNYEKEVIQEGIKDPVFTGGKPLDPVFKGRLESFMDTILVVWGGEL